MLPNGASVNQDNVSGLTPEQFTACTPVEDLSADASADPIAEAPPVAPEVSIASLLAHSREHQKRRTKAANRQTNKHHAPDYHASTQAAQLALDARLEADRRDPDHLDPAWALDPAPHDAIVAFLEKYLVTP